MAAQGKAGEAPANGPGPVKSADRVMLVLDLVAAKGTMSFSEIIETLALPKSSGHALLRTMEDHHYLAVDPNTRNYRLGNRIWELAQSHHGIEDLRTLLKPLMDRLMEETGETVQLARLDGLEAIYLELSESPHPVKLTSKPGARLPAHTSAIGKALLSSLDPEEAAHRLDGQPLRKLTKHTITDSKVLLAELDQIRKEGYSVDEEEFAVGLRCVAMPVRDATGKPVGAMSVSIPTPRSNRTIFSAARQALADTVSEAAEQLGKWPD